MSASSCASAYARHHPSPGHAAAGAAKEFELPSCSTFFTAGGESMWGSCAHPALARRLAASMTLTIRRQEVGNGVFVACIGSAPVHVLYGTVYLTLTPCQEKLY